MFEGYTVYKIFHKKQGRYMAVLYCPKTKHRTTMSYAKYLMVMSLGRPLDKDKETVDHKNDNKLDDRIENLQLLTRVENTKKSAKSKTIITLVCPVCNKEFKRRKGNTHLVKSKNKGYTCCSRKCGGIMSHR